MPDPNRFLVKLPDGSEFSSNDPKEVQDRAEAYATEHLGDRVDLYQHVYSFTGVKDGD